MSHVSSVSMVTNSCVVWPCFSWKLIRLLRWNIYFVFYPAREQSKIESARWKREKSFVFVEMYWKPHSLLSRLTRMGGRPHVGEGKLWRSVLSFVNNTNEGKMWPYQGFHQQVSHPCNALQNPQNTRRTHAGEFQRLLWSEATDFDIAHVYICYFTPSVTRRCPFPLLRMKI